MNLFSRCHVMAWGALAFSLGTGAAQAGCPAALAPATLCTTLTFERFTSAVDGFYGAVATVQDNPVASATNLLAAKIVKGPGGSADAGARVVNFDDVKAPSSVNPGIGFAQGTKISVAVFSSAVGQPVTMRVESALNDVLPAQSQAVSTQANVWEVLVFDFKDKVDPTKTYNRISLIPNFPADTAPAVATTTYFDNLTYPKGDRVVPCVYTGGRATLVDGVFASGYGTTVRNYRRSASEQCGEGRSFADVSAGQLGTYTQFSGDSYFSFYYRLLHTSSVMGGYVNAPKDGYVVVNSGVVPNTDQYRSMTIGVWGNQEWFLKKPPVRVLLTSREVPATATTPACQPTVSAMIDTSTLPNPAAPSYYTLNFSNFTVALACGSANTVYKILVRGVTSVGAAVQAPNFYFPNDVEPGVNGLYIGKIVFNR